MAGVSTALEADAEILWRAAGSEGLESSEPMEGPGVGVKTQQPEDTLLSASWQDTLFTCSTSSAHIAGHTQESKDAVTMMTLLLWWNLIVIPCTLWGVAGRTVCNGDLEKS